MNWFFKLLAMTNPSNDIERLEQKINILILISAIQALVLTCWIVGAMLTPSPITIFIALIVVAVLMFIFRRRIPSWSAAGLRLLVKRFSSDEDQSGDIQIK